MNFIESEVLSFELDKLLLLGANILIKEKLILSMLVQSVIDLTNLFCNEVPRSLSTSAQRCVWQITGSFIE